MRKETLHIGTREEIEELCVNDSFPSPHFDIKKQIDDIIQINTIGFGCIFMMQKCEGPGPLPKLTGEYVEEHFKVNKWFVWIQPTDA